MLVPQTREVTFHRNATVTNSDVITQDAGCDVGVSSKTIAICP